MILAYNNSIVTPSLTTYYDYWEVGGRSFLDESPGQNTYSRAALSKSIPLADRLTLNSKALLGFGGSNFNEVRYRSNDGAGFADYEFSTQLMYAVNERLSVGGKMAFTGLVGGAAGLDRDNISPDEIFWGRNQHEAAILVRECVNARVREFRFCSESQLYIAPR